MSGRRVCLCIVVLRRCCVLAQFNQPLQCQGGAPASASAAQLASRQARKLPGCWSTQCGRHPSLSLPPPTPRLLAEARRGRARWSLCRNISQLCRRALTTFLPQSRGLSSVKTCRSRRVLVSETMNHGPVCASTVHMLFDNGFNYKLVSYCQPGHTPVRPSGDNTLISTR